MSRGRIALLALVACLAVAGTNWASWRGVSAPAATAGDPRAWSALEAITAVPGGWSFPPELTAGEGRELTLTGVLFPLPQLTADGRMSGAVLAPAARFHCCGLACDPRPQLQVFVIFAQPLAAPEQRRLCRVSGRLHLERSGGWTATGLEEARIAWLADPR